MADSKHRSPKVNPPAKLHGGKYYLARRLLDCHPLPDKYIKHVEPYGGLATVKLNLPAATREHPRIDIYNDIDGGLSNLFHILRTYGGQLQRKLALTPYSESEFNAARNWLDAMRISGVKHVSVADRVEWARRVVTALQQSQGGRRGDWSQTKSRTRRGIADVVSGWLSKIHTDLPHIVEVVTEWQIENRPAMECIKYHDSPTTMFYLDPPYVSSSRATADVYEHEMTDAQHEILLEYLVHELKGRCLISGYDSEMYRRWLEDNGEWRRYAFDVANHAAGGKKKRRMTECAWCNF